MENSNTTKARIGEAACEFVSSKRSYTIFLMGYGNGSPNNHLVHIFKNCFMFSKTRRTRKTEIIFFILSFFFFFFYVQKNIENIKNTKFK